MLLVCVGLYGILSQSVSRRTGEIGVRVALGAGQGRIQWLILRESALLLAWGVALGIPAALAAAKAMASLLFGVSFADPRALLVAAAAVAVVAFAAGFHSRPASVARGCHHRS